MLIKRNLLSDLQAHLPKKEMTLLVGPRQAGKTTLMLHLQDDLQKKATRLFF